MWKLSKRDIRFLQTLSYFNAFFGFAPLFHFNQNKIEQIRRFEVLTMPAYFVILVVQIISSYPVIFLDIAVIPVTQIMEAYGIITINVVLYGWCMISSHIIHKKKWKKMFELFLKIDVLLDNQNSINNNLLENINFQFIILLATFIVGFIVRIYDKIEIEEGLWFLILSSFIHVEFSCFYLLTLSFFIWNLCLAIKCRYKNMNDILQMRNKGFFLNSTQDLNIPEIIKMIKAIFEANNEIVSIFNEVFGWQILIMTLKNIALILLIFDGFISKQVTYSSNLQTAQAVFMLLHVVSETILFCLSFSFY